VLRLVGQAVFVLILFGVLRELALNLTFGLRRIGLDLSFDFLDSRAGFDINEGIAYSPNHNILKAYMVGVVNTLRVAAVGVVLATILGTIVGVARLSPNWLVRKIAQVYVEAIRNTPVLIQIIFWWLGVILTLPTIDRALALGGVAVLSNRAVGIAWPHTAEGAGLWGIFLLVGLVAAVAVRRWRNRLSERSGRQHHPMMWSLGAFLALAFIGYLISGGPLFIDTPQVVGRGIRGGLQLTPAYAAIVVGLVVYTAAFIAEIVRGSILAVSKGQKEAAEALGLTRLQQLRFVVIPQAMRIAIPPINSQYLNLTKNSSLALAIGYPDLVSVSRTIMNQTAAATQMLIIVMATYLTLSLTISFAMNLLNRAVTRQGEQR
jgi:general L-amino acid transport system permease protein